MKLGNYKSRKAKKQATRRIYITSHAHNMEPGGWHQGMGGLANRARRMIRGVFGTSKHRNARVQRFQARNR